MALRVPKEGHSKGTEEVYNPGGVTLVVRHNPGAIGLKVYRSVNL
jgi:hypothetical protein